MGPLRLGDDHNTIDHHYHQIPQTLTHPVPRWFPALPQARQLVDPDCEKAKRIRKVGDESRAGFTPIPIM